MGWGWAVSPCLGRRLLVAGSQGPTATRRYLHGYLFAVFQRKRPGLFLSSGT